MLTVENLRALGADVDDGIGRCLGDEAFYLQMVRMVLEDPGFDGLREAIENEDLDTAFDRAHALKGTLANVALTSLADPMIEITEELRARRDMDYTELLDRIDRVLADYRGLL